MTLEIDLERVAVVSARLRGHRAALAAIAEHVGLTGRRMHLEAEAAPVVASAERLVGRLVLAANILTQLAEQASQADADARVDARRSFGGGSALCSAIQLVSPIPSQPSTGGVAGAIDAAGVARDAASIADAGSATIAGRSVPAVTVAAALVDVALCRLGVGSGAGISTRKTVNEDGDEVYEGSMSQHKHQTSNGEPLDPDLERRDRQMWRVEHSNQLGYLMQPYPGYPAYEVNAPPR